MDYEALLYRVLNQTKWVRDRMNEDDAVETMINWMSLYGGDNTCLLISHYGDGLADAIRKALNSNCAK